jgi:hypothetical protein
LDVLCANFISLGVILASVGIALCWFLQ